VVALLLKCIVRINKETNSLKVEQLIEKVSKSLSEMVGIEEEDPIVKTYE